MFFMSRSDHWMRSESRVAFRIPSPPPARYNTANHGGPMRIRTPRIRTLAVATITATSLSACFPNEYHANYATDSSQFPGAPQFARTTQAEAQRARMRALGMDVGPVMPMPRGAMPNGPDVFAK